MMGIITYDSHSDQFSIDYSQIGPIQIPLQYLSGAEEGDFVLLEVSKKIEHNNNAPWTGKFELQSFFLNLILYFSSSSLFYSYFF